VYLTEPEFNETLDDNTPSFSWNLVSGAVGYLLQIDTTSEFNSENLIEVIVWTYNDYTLNESLSDGRWYWQVAGIDDENDVGEFSPYSSFIIDTGAGTGTTTGTFDIGNLLPIILVGGVAILIVVIVIIYRKKSV
jgi:hypothetical protein